MPATGSSSAPQLLRWAHPMGFNAYLREIGAPVDIELKRQGLPTLCEDPNAFLPVRKIWSYWHAAARREDPLLGWHVGRRFGDKLLGQGLLNKLQHAATLYQALHQFVKLVGAEASHLRLGILEREHDILFYTHYPNLKDAPGYEISQSYQLEVYLALIRHYLGHRWLPREVGVEAQKLPLAVLDHFPDTRIVTGARIGYIAVPRACLHVAPPTTSIPAKALQGTASELLRVDQLDEIATLKLLLRAYIAEGYPSARLAASLLGISVRTLARRLAEADLSYSVLVDQVRFEAARDLLKHSDLKVAEIGVAVGFDDPSHFTRMFRRVGGLTPLQYRKSQLGVH